MFKIMFMSLFVLSTCCFSQEEVIALHQKIKNSCYVIKKNGENLYKKSFENKAGKYSYPFDESYFSFEAEDFKNPDFIPLEDGGNQNESGQDKDELKENSTLIGFSEEFSEEFTKN